MVPSTELISDSLSVPLVSLIVLKRSNVNVSVVAISVKPTLKDYFTNVPPTKHMVNIMATAKPQLNIRSSLYHDTIT